MKDLPHDRVQVLVDHMCSDSAKEFNHAEIARIHPSGEPLLDTYYYRRSMGESSTETSAKITTIKEENDGSALDLGKTMQKWAGPGMADNGTIFPIKMEPETPDFIKLKQDIGVLASGKASLEKEHTLAVNLQADMEARSQKDPTLTKPCNDFKVPM